MLYKYFGDSWDNLSMHQIFKVTYETIDFLGRNNSIIIMYSIVYKFFDV